jgi:glycosidase
MRVNDDYAYHNAMQQVSDPNSILAYWGRVLRVRKEHRETMIYGDFRLLDDEHGAIFCYQRIGSNGIATVVTNFTEKQHNWDVPDTFPNAWRTSDVLLANYQKPTELKLGKLLLRPFEALVVFQPREV